MAYTPPAYTLALLLPLPLTLTQCNPDTQPPLPSPPYVPTQVLVQREGAPAPYCAGEKPKADPTP